MLNNHHGSAAPAAAQQMFMTPPRQPHQVEQPSPFVGDNGTSPFVQADAFGRPQSAIDAAKTLFENGIYDPVMWGPTTGPTVFGQTPPQVLAAMQASVPVQVEQVSPAAGQTAPMQPMQQGFVAPQPLQQGFVAPQTMQQQPMQQALMAQPMQQQPMQQAPIPQPMQPQPMQQAPMAQPMQHQPMQPLPQQQDVSMGDAGGKVIYKYCGFCGYSGNLHYYRTCWQCGAKFPPLPGKGKGKGNHLDQGNGKGGGKGGKGQHPQPAQPPNGAQHGAQQGAQHGAQPNGVQQGARQNGAQIHGAQQQGAQKNGAQQGAHNGAQNNGARHNGAQQGAQNNGARSFNDDNHFNANYPQWMQKFHEEIIGCPSQVPRSFQVQFYTAKYPHCAESFSVQQKWKHSLEACRNYSNAIRKIDMFAEFLAKCRDEASSNLVVALSERKKLGPEILKLAPNAIGLSDTNARSTINNLANMAGIPSDVRAKIAEAAELCKAYEVGTSEDCHPASSVYNDQQQPEFRVVDEAAAAAAAEEEDKIMRESALGPEARDFEGQDGDESDFTGVETEEEVVPQFVQPKNSNARPCPEETPPLSKRLRCKTATMGPKQPESIPIHSDDSFETPTPEKKPTRGQCAERGDGQPRRKRVKKNGNKR